MNPMDAFFDLIREKVAYKKWFFGSFHMDKLIPPGEVALFQSFAEMKPDATLFGAKPLRNKRKKRMKLYIHKRSAGRVKR